jgi:hypothetical protein
VPPGEKFSLGRGREASTKKIKDGEKGEKWKGGKALESGKKLTVGGNCFNMGTK